MAKKRAQGLVHTKDDSILIAFAAEACQENLTHIRSHVRTGNGQEGGTDVAVVEWQTSLHLSKCLTRDGDGKSGTGWAVSALRIGGAEGQLRDCEGGGVTEWGGAVLSVPKTLRF